MAQLLKTDIKLLPLIFVGMLMFFTVFVKGIPIVTLINEKIGGDKFDPSGKAIVVEGTLFVIRSVVKFLVMNVGCAMSDHIGRKPITLFFILPNVCMDGMLLFAEIDPPVIFSIGALWGLTSITLPTLRAWVCDLCCEDPVEMVNAQGSFRGLTIGPATLLGIPLGTAFALYSNPKYAFVCSLFANILALVIIGSTNLDDTIGIVKQQHKTQINKINNNSIEMAVSSSAVASSSSSSSPQSQTQTQTQDSSPLHSSQEPQDCQESSSLHLRFTDGGTSIVSLSSQSQSHSNQSRKEVKRSFPSEGMWMFCWEHSPWSGYEVIVELYEKNPSASFLWLVYFLTFCANEVRILF